MVYLRGLVERDFEHLVRSAIQQAGSILDIGCGLGDYLHFTQRSQRVVAIEPHLPYLEKARARVPWAEFHHTDGTNYFLHSREMFDCILMIDVVEHLEPRQACRLVREALRHAKKIVLSLIPYGVHEQTKDAWNLGGEFWQTHRSTWDSTNLGELGFSFFHVWKNWYEWDEVQTHKTRDTTIAVWIPEFTASQFQIQVVPSIPEGSRTVELSKTLESILSQSYPCLEVTYSPHGFSRLELDSFESYRLIDSRIHSEADLSHSTAPAEKRDASKAPTGRPLIQIRTGEVLDAENLEQRVLHEEKDHQDTDQATSWAKLISMLRDGIQASSAPGSQELVPTQCQFYPWMDGTYSLWLRIAGKDGQTFTVNGRLPYEIPPLVLNVSEPESKNPHQIPITSVFKLWTGNYDLKRAEQQIVQERLKNGKVPSVAFTVRDSSILGGGTQTVYRYANWLSDLGIEVAIYSNDTPPAWVQIKGKFHQIKEDLARYTAIRETVIIAYSVLELPLLLQALGSSSRPIFHLCQGVEDFHYFFKPGTSSLPSVPIFELLNTLPVGRIAVSHHVHEHFLSKYGQSSRLILNGIDTRAFTPRWKRPLTNNLNILVSGNPWHPLKGVACVKEALSIVAKRRPDWSLHLINVCGGKMLPTSEADTSPLGFTTSLYYGLSPQEMKEMYEAADLFINASWYEGFGLPTLEAMACGVPVIQVDNRGLDGIVAKDRNCLLVPYQDGGMIAAAIERLVEDPALREQLTSHGLQDAPKYSLGSQYRMFVKEFESILGATFDQALVDREERQLTLGPARQDPLFSILVPTYNQAGFLPGCLDSLLGQTYPHWEALVVNDGSTDDTALVMERYALKDRRIRIFHKKNGGVASALNEALRNARGDWIFWLSSDDLFEARKLEVHRKAIENSPETRLFHTHFSVMDETIGKVYYGEPNPDGLIPPPDMQVLKFFEINYFNGISIAIHHSLFDEHGVFREEFSHAQDFEMWLRLSTHHQSHFIEDRTCITRIHPAQGTSLAPEIGIYDSARACLEFLNQHLFQELFPLLDLRRQDHAIRAVQNSLSLVVNPRSFINRLGYGGALLGRLTEWLCRECTSDLRATLIPQIEQVVRQIQQAPIPREIKVIFSRIPKALRTGEPYKQQDPLELMMEHAARLESFGSPAEATCIRKYFEKLTAKQSPATRPSTGLQPTRATSTLILHSGIGPFPKVSVIVPTYNRPLMLERALQSILAQSFRDFEIVVVNDGGDDVESMIQQWNRDRNIVYVRHASNLDRAAARNSAIRIAQGKYIAYLDDDDVWYPDHLQSLVSYMEETGQKVAYTDADRAHQVLNEGIYVTVHKDQPYSFDFDPNQILVGNFIPILCLMHERDCLNEIGLFDETLTTNEDWDLWIRMSRRYPFGHLKKITCEFSWRTDGSSTTSRKREDFMRTLRVVYDKYRELVVARPEIQEAQKKRLQVEEQSLLQVSSRSRAKDHVLSGIPCEPLLASHPELVGTLDRVKRYLDEGRISLALKIAHKELGPHEEAQQLIARLREQDLENQLAAVH